MKKIEKRFILVALFAAFFTFASCEKEDPMVVVDEPENALMGYRWVNLYKYKVDGVTHIINKEFVFRTKDSVNYTVTLEEKWGPFSNKDVQVHNDWTYIFDGTEGEIRNPHAGNYIGYSIDRITYDEHTPEKLMWYPNGLYTFYGDDSCLVLTRKKL